MRQANKLLKKMRRLVEAHQPTPLTQLESDELDLFAKLEFHNPTHSLKDRPAMHVLMKAIERGDIDETSAIIESSSGNFAIALASLAKRLNLEFIPVIDPNITPANKRVLKGLCAQTIMVTTLDEMGGYQRQRIATVKKYLETNPGLYWPNQYANYDCMEAHYLGTAGEIGSQLSGIDYAFIPVSSGGTISGCSRRLKEDFPSVQIIAVDAVGSAIFGGVTKKRYIPGIGSTSRPELLDLAQIDQVVHVSDYESIAGCHALLNRHGVFAGGSSGALYAAIQNFKFPPKKTRHRVVFLCPDQGTSYVDTIFNPDWCSSIGCTALAGDDPKQEVIFG